MVVKDILLEKSNSYNFYKKEYEKLLEENKTLKGQLKECKSKSDEKVDLINKRYESKINRLNKKVDNLSKKINSNERHNERIHNELKYAFVFNDTIKESEWLIDKKFSLVNSAANYSFAYTLYRILDEAQPKNILELGLGQTSRITSQYANFFKDVKLSIVESDSVWIEKFSKNLEITDNINVYHSELELFDFEDEENLRFKDISKIVGDDKFDLIIIDGPQGFIPTPEGDVFTPYPRSNIWNLIPDNLASDFIIIMDDYNRRGEKRTMHHVEELLSEENIEFYNYSSVGLKEQYVLCSEKYVYVTWF